MNGFLVLISVVFFSFSFDTFLLYLQFVTGSWDKMLKIWSVGKLQQCNYIYNRLPAYIHARINHISSFARRQGWNARSGRPKSEKTENRCGCWQDQGMISWKARGSPFLTLWRSEIRRFFLSPGRFLSWLCPAITNPFRAFSGPAWMKYAPHRGITP